MGSATGRSPHEGLGRPSGRRPEARPPGDRGGDRSGRHRPGPGPAGPSSPRRRRPRQRPQPSARAVGTRRDAESSGSSAPARSARPWGSPSTAPAGRSTLSRAGTSGDVNEPRHWPARHAPSPRPRRSSRRWNSSSWPSRTMRCRPLRPRSGCTAARRWSTRAAPSMPMSWLRRWRPGPRSARSIRSSRSRRPSGPSLTSMARRSPSRRTTSSPTCSPGWPRPSVVGRSG